MLGPQKPGRPSKAAMKEREEALLTLQAGVARTVKLGEPAAKDTEAEEADKGIAERRRSLPASGAGVSKGGSDVKKPRAASVVRKSQTSGAELSAFKRDGEKFVGSRARVNVPTVDLDGVPSKTWYFGTFVAFATRGPKAGHHKIKWEEGGTTEWLDLDEEEIFFVKPEA